jgi:hypothetical protein
MVAMRVEQQEQLPDDFPLLDMDHTKPWFLTSFGKKNSGKSVFSRSFYRSWPGDKLCIDVNGNAGPGEDAETVPIEVARGGKWPARQLQLGERPRPRNLYVRANPMSPTFVDDLDRAVGMALLPQDHTTLLWAGEVNKLMPNGRPGPHLNTVLEQNRHYHVPVIFDGPRPVWLSPTVLMQADLVAVYRLPQVSDRKRIAECIGAEYSTFERVCRETWRTDPHAFVLCDLTTPQTTLWQCPPLPIDDELKTKGAAAA